MTSLSLKEKFARLGPTRVVDQNESGSPVILALRPSPNGRGVETIPAIQALFKRGMTMLRAKRAIENMVENGRAVILVPKVESVLSLSADLAKHGISTTLVGDYAIDIKSIRERIGLSQEEFALRYGLDLDSLQNWEAGRRKMPKAVRSYLMVISSMPQQASEALEHSLAEVGMFVSEQVLHLR